MDIKAFWNETLNYRNPGPDKRPLGRVGGVLQGLFSIPFDWKHDPPKQLARVDKSALYWPPFVAINVRQDGKWRTLRAGWRWDSNYEGYIADVIIKLDEDQAHI